MTCPDGSDLKAYVNTTETYDGVYYKYPYWWFCESNNYFVPISNCPHLHTSKTLPKDQTIPDSLKNLDLLCHDHQMIAPNGCHTLGGSYNNAESKYSFIITDTNNYKLYYDYPLQCPPPVIAD